MQGMDIGVIAFFIGLDHYPVIIVDCEVSAIILAVPYDGIRALDAGLVICQGAR